MDFTYLSLIGAFAMLVFGLTEYAIMQRMLYIPLRDRFERAKVTGAQGLNPSIFWTALRLINFIVLPVIGFVFGDMILRPLIG